MLTEETMLKLVKHLQDKHTPCEINSEPGRPMWSPDRIKLPHYLVKIVSSPFIDDSVVEYLNSIIKGAGLEDSVRWKIEEGYVHFFGKFSETERLYIKKEK